MTAPSAVHRHPGKNGSSVNNVSFRNAKGFYIRANRNYESNLNGNRNENIDEKYKNVNVNKNTRKYKENENEENKNKNNRNKKNGNVRKNNSNNYNNDDNNNDYVRISNVNNNDDNNTNNENNDDNAGINDIEGENKIYVNDTNGKTESSPVSKYIFANIQGLRHISNNKIPFIGGLLNETDALFAAFTETHTRKCFDSELCIDGYNLYRSERKSREMGGCCLYTHKSLICNEILKSTNDMVELLIVKIENMNLIIMVLYRPPGTSLQKFSEQLKNIEVFLNSVDRPSPNIMLLGDFNFPHLKWELKDGQANITEVGGATKDEKNQVSLLLKLCNDYNLCQFVWKKTRKNNTLDLIFTNNEALVHHIEVTPTTFSDHNIIEVTSRLNVPHQEKSMPVPYSKDDFSVFNFNKNTIDWDAINHSLSEIDWNELGESKNESAYLKVLLKSAVNLCSSCIRKRSKRRPKTVRYLRNLYKRRSLICRRLGNNLIRQLHKSKIEDELNIIENKLKSYYRTQAEEAEINAINQLKSNSRFFYSYAKKKQSTPTGIGPLRRDDGSFTDRSQEMAELLSKQYKSVFSKPKVEYKIENPDVFFFDENVIRPNITDIQMTPDDFIKAIDEMPMHCAPGPDTWNSVFIKKCKNSLALPFCILWRKSLDTGFIPDSQLLTDIAPLHKGGGKALPKNYRPIALTSHVIKIFERVLRCKLMEYIETNNLYNPNQHGFRPGRSCLSQLLDHFDKALKAMEDKKNLDVVYTDFAKAFDKCDHGIIAHKLKEIGITGKVGRWIYYFLSHRFQRVVVNGHKSNPAKVVSSVPQGTVLAPLLFLILISDIDKNALHSFVSSFADDTRIGKEISSVEDTQLLQEDINQVFSWAEENNMEFNEEKFQLIRYGTHEDIKNQTKYETKSRNIIEKANEVKDLGVIMTDDLSFESHNQRKINETRRLAGWIMRVFKTREQLPMLTLYKSLILPRIEYCCILTSPFKSGEISDIESIQRSFTAQIDNAKHLNYWERLKFLNLYSLERRRERYIVIYTWKILEGLVPNFSSNVSKITCYWSDRYGRKCKIPSLIRRGNIRTKRENFLSVKGPRLFNTLPPHLRNSAGQSLETFKSHLDKFLKDIPDEPGLPGYVASRAAGTNSLVDQVHPRRAWAMPGPQEQI